MTVKRLTTHDVAADLELNAEEYQQLLEALDKYHVASTAYQHALENPKKPTHTTILNMRRDFAASYWIDCERALGKLTFELFSPLLQLTDTK